MPRAHLLRDTRSRLPGPRERRRARVRARCVRIDLPRTADAPGHRSRRPDRRLGRRLPSGRVLGHGAPRTRDRRATRCARSLHGPDPPRRDRRADRRRARRWPPSSRCCCVPPIVSQRPSAPAPPVPPRPALAFAIPDRHVVVRAARAVRDRRPRPAFRRLNASLRAVRREHQSTEGDVSMRISAKLAPAFLLPRPSLSSSPRHRIGTRRAKCRSLRPRDRVPRRAGVCRSAERRLPRSLRRAASRSPTSVTPSR